MGRGLKVLKFGGSSLASPGDVRRVVSIICEAVPDDDGIIVVSALKGVTNKLVDLADNVEAVNRAGRLKEIRDRHLNTGSALLSSTTFEGYRKIVDGLCVQLWKRVGNTAVQDPALRDEVLAVGERLSAPLLAACILEYRRPGAAHDASMFIRTNDYD